MRADDDLAARSAALPWPPTLGDVDSWPALADDQSATRVHQKAWRKARA